MQKEEEKSPEKENSELEETTAKPPDDKQPETAHHYVTMRNKQGQKYHCSVPLLHDELSTNKEGDSSTDLTQSQDAEEKKNYEVSCFYSLSEDDILS